MKILEPTRAPRTMKTQTIFLLGGLTLAGWLLAGPAFKGTSLGSAREKLTDPAARLKCPVCGMFVDRHAAWRGSIQFRDGHEVAFDGAKDLFKYHFYLPRYTAEKTTGDIRSLAVTDYYSLDSVDGYRAHYVVGSDVLGPMGHELIPFATEQAAREFLRDHHGKEILTFDEVTKETISRLEGEEPVNPDVGNPSRAMR